MNKSQLKLAELAKETANSDDDEIYVRFISKIILIIGFHLKSNVMIIYVVFAAMIF